MKSFVVRGTIQCTAGGERRFIAVNEEVWANSAIGAANIVLFTVAKNNNCAYYKWATGPTVTEVKSEKRK